MSVRINRAIELLAAGQPVSYCGEHSGHVLTFAQGQKDAQTWADYINVGMEHGAFDMAGLDAYLAGLAAGGPTASGHRMPAVIVEPPVDATSEAVIRANAWQFRQLLARGIHGLLLCMAESAEAVRAFVAACRYPIHMQGVGEGLSCGTRGKGGEATAAAVWGIRPEEYLERADAWPLNPQGELLLGVKIETPAGVANVEQILSVPGLGFAEMGPNDLSFALGHRKFSRDPYHPPELGEARERILRACKKNGVAFLECCAPGTVAAKMDEGVAIVTGGRPDTAAAARAHARQAHSE